MTTINQSIRKMKISKLGSDNSLPTFRSNTLMEYKLHDEVPPSVSEGFFKEAYIKFLPYTTQDHYNRAQNNDTMPTIALENSKLKATFYPKYGGRLASLFDKEKQKELLFDNPVFQPANLAIRNAWFSGGIEWNGPVFGHSLLTCSPIYFAKVKTDGQEVLRIYEYDRYLNMTWQIDFYLPENSNNLWYHVTARNLNNFEIPFYWWTNIATPLTEKIRVVTPSKETLNHVIDGLGVCPWPIENNIDISYPSKYKTSMSVFYLMPKEKAPWFTYSDENGYGLFHMATPKLKGKKLFYFGYGQGGTNWMNTLSLPGKGQYIELQAGITETQSQTTPIAANSILSWTECVGPLNCNAQKIHQQDYSIAVNHTHEKLFESGLFNQIDEMDRKMTSWLDITPEEILHEGEAWGSIYEKMSATKIPGLRFTAPITEKEKPWNELVVDNNFSNETLQKDPVSWNISTQWQQKLEDSIKAGKNSWLHQLHLGATYMEKKERQKAKEYFEASIRLKNNFQSLRGLAIIELMEGSEEKAIEAYMRAWQHSNGNEDLFNELSVILRDKNKISQLKNLVNDCPSTLKTNEYYTLAKATIALNEAKYEEARQLLIREYIYIKEGELVTTNIWFNTFYFPAEKKLGRPLTEDEKATIKAQNPPPVIIDFQMKG